MGLNSPRVYEKKGGKKRKKNSCYQQQPLEYQITKCPIIHGVRMWEMTLSQLRLAFPGELQRCGWSLPAVPCADICCCVLHVLLTCSSHQLQQKKSTKKRLIWGECPFPRPFSPPVVWCFIIIVPHIYLQVRGRYSLVEHLMRKITGHSQNLKPQWVRISSILWYESILQMLSLLILFCFCLIS